jgi:hypothetical protein
VAVETQAGSRPQLATRENGLAEHSTLDPAEMFSSANSSDLNRGVSLAAGFNIAPTVGAKALKARVSAETHREGLTTDERFKSAGYLSRI